MNKILSFTCLLLASNMAFSGVYNSNITGTITSILSYPNGTVFIVLDNQPSSHPKCDHNFFEISKDYDPKGADRMYTRFLTSYAKGERVNIGYDNGSDSSSSCGPSGRISIHRAG